jgi:hypothetical protein
MTIWIMCNSLWVPMATHTLALYLSLYLRICNTYWFFTATMVARTHLNVTLYVH